MGWLWAVLTLLGLWVTGLILVGLVPSLPRRRRTGPLPLLRFRVFIPAHNEEAVIGAAVRSVYESGYPADRLDVVVLADRCSDATVARARAAGARVVERTSGPAGKAHVLRYGFSRVGIDGVDAIVVLDADNQVSPGIFQALAARLAEGASAVQAPVLPRGRRTPVSAAYWALSALHHAYQRGRQRLGLPVLLGGTGWAVRADVLRRVPLATVSLVEDLEYTWLLALAGYRVVYAEGTATYDEKPVRLADSIRQRLRWARGQWQLLAALAPRWRRLRPAWVVDLLSHALVPWWTVVLWWYLFTGGAGWLLSYLSDTTLWVAVATIAGGLSVKGLLDGLFLPIITLTQGPILVWSLLTWRSQEWVRTPHVG